MLGEVVQALVAPALVPLELRTSGHGDFWAADFSPSLSDISSSSSNSLFETGGVGR